MMEIRIKVISFYTESNQDSTKRLRGSDSFAN